MTDVACSERIGSGNGVGNALPFVNGLISGGKIQRDGASSIDDVNLASSIRCPTTASNQVLYPIAVEITGCGCASTLVAEQLSVVVVTRRYTIVAQDQEISRVSLAKIDSGADI